MASDLAAYSAAGKPTLSKPKPYRQGSPAARLGNTPIRQGGHNGHPSNRVANHRCAASYLLFMIKAYDQRFEVVVAHLT